MQFFVDIAVYANWYAIQIQWQCVTKIELMQPQTGTQTLKCTKVMQFKIWVIKIIL